MTDLELAEMAELKKQIEKLEKELATTKKELTKVGIENFLMTAELKKIEDDRYEEHKRKRNEEFWAKERAKKEGKE